MRFVYTYLKVSGLSYPRYHISGVSCMWRH